MTGNDEHTPLSEMDHILKVDSGQAGNRLDAVLALIFGDYGLRARRRLWEWRAITVDGVERKPSYKVREGQVIRVSQLNQINQSGPLKDETTGAGAPSGGFDLDGLREEMSGAAGAERAFGPTQLVPSVVGAQEELLAARLGLDGTLGDLPRASSPAEKHRPAVKARDFSAFIPAIVAANEDFVAFYKPDGLPSVTLAGGQGPSMEALLAEHWPLIWQRYAGNGERRAQPLLCNRLDTPTSGLLLAAFSSEKLDFFRACERDGKAKKKYLAMAHGIAPEYLLLDKTLDTYRRKTTLVLPHTDLDYTRHSRAVRLKTFETPEQVRAGEGGAPSPRAAQSGQGDFDAASDLALGYAAHLGRDDASMSGLVYLVGLTGPLSLLEVAILRGARHQIRAHLAGAGYPIVGDTQYGLESTGRGGRLYLHHSEINLPGFRAEVLPDWSFMVEN